MAYDFPQIVKYLDYVPSRKITKDEADFYDPQTSPLSKYQRIVNTRAIKKLQVSFSLLAHTVPFATSSFIGQLLFQYNFTFSGRMFITNTLAENASIVGGCLAVKYRIGSTVYRYALGGSQLSIFRTGPVVHSTNCVNFPLYTGQAIDTNCVFEFWSNFNSQAPSDPVGITSDILINTSRLVNPHTADETSSTYNSVAAIDRINFAVATPQALPYVQPVQVWLTN